jgi:hypothetical protein
MMSGSDHPAPASSVRPAPLPPQASSKKAVSSPAAKKTKKGAFFGALNAENKKMSEKEGRAKARAAKRQEKVRNVTSRHSASLGQACDWL